MKTPWSGVLAAALLASSQASSAQVPAHGRPEMRPAARAVLRPAAQQLPAAAAPLPLPVATALPAVVESELRRAAIPLAATGLLVQEVGAATPLVALNPGQSLNPASVMKLVTTLAALDLLGPAYTWKTIAASSGTLGAAPLNAAPGASNGANPGSNTGVAPAGNAAEVLHGDLYLKGAGDPKLVLESFWLLLRQLRQRGVREIRGDVVVDRSAFAIAPHDPARFDADPLRPYNVGPDALLVNFKSVTYRFVPDARQRHVRVVAEPLLGAHIVAPRLDDGPCGDWRGGLKADFSNPARPVFAGSYPRACGERNWSVAVLTANDYFDRLFRQLWAEAGGSLSGGVREGPMPADAVVLAERESPPLAEVVRDINKFSNNVMARQVYLTLPLELERQPGSTERAERIVRNWLDTRGLGMPELVMENGSGLSRIERISAAGLGRLLLAAFAAPVMPEFVASLPLVGNDGTMRRRLGARGAAGRAHIKTGTLSDVRAIAGYVLGMTGKRYVVVAMVNHGNAGAAQGAFDALLQWVAERN